MTSGDGHGGKEELSSIKGLGTKTGLQNGGHPHANSFVAPNVDNGDYDNGDFGSKLKVSLFSSPPISKEQEAKGFLIILVIAYQHGHRDWYL